MKLLILWLGVVTLGSVTIHAQEFRVDLAENDLTGIRRAIVRIPFENLNEEQRKTQAILAKRLIEDVFTLRIVELYRLLRSDSPLRDEELYLRKAQPALKRYSPLSQMLTQDAELLNAGVQVDFVEREKNLQNVAIVHVFTTLQMLRSEKVTELISIAPHFSQADLRHEITHLENLEYCAEPRTLSTNDEPLTQAQILLISLRQLEDSLPQKQRVRLFAIQTILDLVADSDKEHQQAASRYATRLLQHPDFLNEMRQVAKVPTPGSKAVAVLCEIKSLAGKIGAFPALEEMLTEQAKHLDIEWALKLGLPAHPKSTKNGPLRGVEELSGSFR